MREISFRGKNLKTGKWTQGYLFRCWERAYIAWGMINDNADMVEVDHKTVCQYTGLTDKNGRKIFEGDILCNHYYEKFPEEETMSVIVWDRFGWGIKYRDIVGKLDDFDCKNGEVTGNIFDNADLIRR